jgi:hypothetical protein
MNRLFSECALDWLAVWRIETEYSNEESQFSGQRSELFAKYRVGKHLDWRKRFLLAVNSVDLLVYADFFVNQFEYVLWCKEKSKRSASVAVYLVDEEKRKQLLLSHWNESLPVIGFFVQMMMKDQESVMRIDKEMGEFQIEAQWCKKREFFRFSSSSTCPNSILPEPIKEFIIAAIMHLLSMKPESEVFMHLLGCINKFTGKQECPTALWYDWKSKYHANAAQMLQDFSQNHFSFLRQFPDYPKEEVLEQLLQLKEQLFRRKILFGQDTKTVVGLCKLLFGKLFDKSIHEAVLWNPFYEWLVERKVFLVVHLQKDLFSFLEGLSAVEQEFIRDFPGEFIQQCDEIVERSLSSLLIHRLDCEKSEICLKEYSLTFPLEKTVIFSKESITFLGNLAHVQNFLVKKLLPLAKDSTILSSLEVYVQQLLEDSCWKSATMMVFGFFSKYFSIFQLTKSNVQNFFQPILQKCTQKMHPSHCNPFICNIYKAFTLACTNSLYASASKVITHCETLSQIQNELEEVEDFFVRHSNSLYGVEWEEAQKASLQLFLTCKFFSIVTPQDLLELYLDRLCQNKAARTFYMKNSKYFDKDHLIYLIKQFSK